MKEARKALIGQQIFGQINGYPPAHWRCWGRINGTWMLEHVCPTQQSQPYPDQGIGTEELLRRCGIDATCYVG